MGDGKNDASRPSIAAVKCIDMGISEKRMMKSELRKGRDANSAVLRPNLPSCAMTDILGRGVLWKNCVGTMIYGSLVIGIAPFICIL